MEEKCGLFVKKTSLKVYVEEEDEYVTKTGIDLYRYSADEWRALAQEKGIDHGEEYDAGEDVLTRDDCFALMQERDEAREALREARQQAGGAAQLVTENARLRAELEKARVLGTEETTVEAAAAAVPPRKRVIKSAPSPSARALASAARSGTKPCAKPC